MALDHFSHEHKLNLEEVRAKPREKIICDICEEQLSSSEEAYWCRDCKFFLHKVCAKRPRDINHPIHPQHPLRLIPNRSGYINCNSCNELCNGFNYHCQPCDFDLHIQCALPQQTRNYEHIHHHPLTFQTRFATFTCNFCRLKDEDQSYQCYTCPFWIHKKCASMPLTNLLNFHPHPLSLVQGIPEEQRIYGHEYVCTVCDFIPWTSDWIYCCGPCRYFVHVGCIKVITDQIQAYYSPRDAADYFKDSFFKFILNDDLLHLPADNIAVDLIQRFLVEKNRLIDIKPEIHHFNHKQHPLILFTEQMVNNDEYFEEEDEEILCDGCIEPITAPYYCCAECNYYLHVPCAHLPSKLQHPAHSHELTLSKTINFYRQVCCKHCRRYTNGLTYGCTDCKFYLDLKCAALPTVIIHEVHEHPLFLQEKASGAEICAARNDSGDGGDLIFKCKQCDDYSLRYDSVMLPKKFRHRWDRNHPIRLRFPPHYEHPNHIMCDMCEEIIHPERWLYSCFKCKVSFHLRCPPRLSKDPNIKYGGEVQISTHSHPFKFLRQPTLKTSCDACGDKIREFDDVFECETCYACMCYTCVTNQIS